MELKLPAIRGIGEAILYLIDRYEDGASIYDITHNVYRGRMDYWADSCDDLPACLDRLAKLGMRFMKPPPDTYYEMLEERLPGHGEPCLLLQIFSETLIGPIFFEFIQRKCDEGFGEGNFQALFDSIEREQLARGTIKTDAAP